ncbi:MAG TPA: hypothetical protein PLI09_12160 [Candidatus Hydrogenedentes bacterium]|nr:hypothetical protein [Candidatus Hydrogenedentota bacterium]
MVNDKFIHERQEIIEEIIAIARDQVIERSPADLSLRVERAHGALWR